VSETGKGARTAPRFVLYSRNWCHLCEDMLGALRACMARQGQAYTVDVVDVDADPALVARFDELVPVLFADGAESELCHYFLDEAALLRHLARLGLGCAESAAAG
jgi:thioredoxin-like negative regulator of GroEL